LTDPFSGRGLLNVGTAPGPFSGTDLFGSPAEKAGEK